jgi:hypothetical protein
LYKLCNQRRSVDSFTEQTGRRGPY